MFDFQKLFGRILLRKTGIGNDLNIRLRRAIAHGRLGAGELDFHVVYLQSRQGGQDMLHGVDFDLADAQRGAALKIDDVIDIGRNFGAILEIGANERDTVVNRRGGKRDCGLTSGMKAGSREAGRLFYGSLHLSHVLILVRSDSVLTLF